MLPGVIRGPLRKYGRIGASVDSLELIEAVLLSCAGSRFRLKTAPIMGRVVDLGISITSFDREKFVAGVRM